MFLFKIHFNDIKRPLKYKDLIFIVNTYEHGTFILKDERTTECVSVGLCVPELENVSHAH